MRVALLTTVIAAASVAAFAVSRLDAGAAGYKRDLLGAIRAASRIVVTEHSYKYDAVNEVTGESLLPEMLVYTEVSLTAEQSRRLASMVEELADNTQNMFPACAFVPHHRIRFYSGERLTSTMEICFHCGQVKWAPTSSTPPWGLAGGLRSFIEAIGLHPELDWEALAREHLKQ